jgi:hypothetical protein
MGGLEHVEKLMGETADAIAYQQVSPVLESLVEQANEMIGSE